ncbi:MAG: NADH-quinone oxidoreductase subunit H [Phycisphaeraceae bacterium]|nr:NADH-quinone oxidoreductase subunit H [Phycisphaerae bacterium]MBX3391929.1 NADH-quinone oxidoreductase subunit H [Phycisphaeraceae bacterium]HRJ48904.1 NADH-quinone oxidoreductase subunit H [Phycisphaerales bacterium]
MEGLLTVQLLVNAVVCVVVIHVILAHAGLFIYFERKISAYMQDRIGPNRTGFNLGQEFLPRFGFWGLGQSLADGIKFFVKEDFTPANVDKALFSLAPLVGVVPALIGFIVIPWGGVWDAPDMTILGLTFTGGPVVVAGANINIGVVFLLAVASLGVYGVTLGGWASNNKYSFLGGLRCTAQMISYEIPLGLALLAVLLLAGTVIPDEIVRHQTEHGWMLLSQPIAAAIFFICGLAEANRAPFDNAECEQELVGGFHTEYSSMRYALFPLAEYAHMTTAAAFFTLLFLGGYHLPFLPGAQPEHTVLAAAFLKFVVFFSKTVLVVCFMMVVRWTIPRLRFDQVMMVGWQSVIPISLLAVVVTSVMVYMGQTDLVSMLIANGVMAAGILAVMPLMPRYTANRRIRLYGSRFSPMPDEVVFTGPVSRLAREDRPVEGSVATH